MPFFNCPSCNVELEADGSLSGREFTCPECGEVNKITSLPDITEKLTHVPDANFEQGMTISEYMFKHNLEGGQDLNADTVNILPESQKGEKYAVGDMVARGGMGGILKARDLNIRRQIAMKVMLEENKPSDDDILRFIEEAQVTGQLEHPNITPVHELGVNTDGQLYFTMKMIKGRNLKDILKDIRKGKPKTVKDYPLNHLLNIFLKICDAIAFAHSKGVVHRDLKPENIMVGEFGEVLVIDWGIAKILQSDTSDRDKSKQSSDDDQSLPDWVMDDIKSSRQDDASQRTMAGTVVGTPHFMAPEQAQGKVEEINEKTDIYALGAILYNILTLNKPVYGDSVIEVLLKVVNGEIESPTVYNPKTERTQRTKVEQGAVTLLRHCPQHQVPNALSAVVMKAMALHADERYGSVKELQSEIEKFQLGYATDAEEASLMRQFNLMVKRHKGEVTLAAAALLLIVAGTVVAFWQVNKQRVTAKNNAMLAEKNAEEAALAKREAEKNASAAIAAKSKAEENLKIARRSSYISKIALAQANIDNGYNESARILLQSCAPEFRNYEWHRLNLMADIGTQKDNGHRNKLDDLAFSHDGKFIASGGGDGQVKIWDVNSRMCIMTLRDDYDVRIRAVDFSPDGRYVLSGSEDSLVKIWDLRSGKKVKVLKGHKDKVSSAVFSKDGKWIVSGSDDASARLWDVATGKAVQEYVGHKNQILDVSISANSQYVLTASADNSCIVWDRRTGKPIRRYVTGYAFSAGFSPDNQHFVTATNELKVWNINSPRAVRTLGKIGFAFSLNFSPDGSKILASESWRASLWDFETGNLVKGFGGQYGRCSATFSPDGKHIITTNLNNEILLRDLTGKVIKVFNGKPGFQELNKINEQHLRVFKGHYKWIWDAGFSPNGKWIASGAGDHSVKIWDRKTAKIIHSISPGRGYVWAVHFSPDSKKLLSSSHNNHVMVWDVKTGKRLLAIKVGMKQSRTARFSPDMKYIATGSDDSLVRLWDARNGKHVRTFKGHESTVRSLAFTPDSKMLLSGANDNTVRLWDVNSGKEIYQRQPGGQVLAVAFNRDGTRFLTGSTFAAALWDTKSGKTIKKLQGHKAAVKAVAFSPDEKRILTGSHDFTAKLWDLKSGNELITFQGHKAAIAAVAFSPDGKSILTGSADRTIRLWFSTKDEK